MAIASSQSASRAETERRFERLAHYIDLDQYPIHDLSSPRASALIERCHEMMRAETLCVLPGFLTEAATREMAREVEAVEAEARPNKYPATAYGWKDNRGFAEDHPRRRLHLRDVGILTTEQLAADGLCLDLFQFDELTEFVRRLLDLDTLYRWACPTLGVMINVMRENQRFGWHFDANEWAVSLMIQEADVGGTFDYVPLIRTEDDENDDGLQRVFDGVDTPRSLKIPTGAFTLFMGRRSLHRVARVGPTARARVTLLYSYDQSADMVSPESVCLRVKHPTADPFMGLESLETDS
ncbi:hypothetical protein [Roseibium sp.]|uniref:HalD/BesD family halogenase n=1 Tax=Roseibium sp. TaxID=1936156 RepID=UPI00326703A9